MNVLRGLRPGTPAVLREVWRGLVFIARPVIVVEDSPAQWRFFVAPGSSAKAPVGPDGRPMRVPSDAGWTFEDRAWEGGPVLSFAWPDVAHAVLAFWDRKGLAGWYVNLQEPLRRTSIGFDTFDHCLDVLVSADRSSWRWKDEDELEEAVHRGLFTQEQSARFRAEGRRASQRLMRGEPPFDRDWSRWRPDPAWPVPTLPEGWDLVGDEEEQGP
jgi:hypothetical protein